MTGMRRTGRTWTTWAAALVVALLAVACTAGRPQPQGQGQGQAPQSPYAGRKLVIASWGGAYQEAQRKAHFERFAKKYGVEIVEASPTDYGKIKAMVESGNVEWDVVDVDLDAVPRLAAQGLLEPLDWSKMKKEDFIPGTVFDHGVGNIFFSEVIACHTRTYPPDKCPKTWAEFWDVQKFPGKRSLERWPVSVLEAALLADGVPPDQLYPLDVERAFRSLDRIKPYVTVWWETGSQAAQVLTDGEVDIGTAWSGRVYDAMVKQGAPVYFHFNQALLRGDAWVILKGTKNYDLAMEFIAFASTPEQQAELTKYIPYGPTNRKAFDYIDKSVWQYLPTSPENLAKQVVVDVNWWVKNFDQVNERFQAWLLQK